MTMGKTQSVSVKHDTDRQNRVRLRRAFVVCAVLLLAVPLALPAQARMVAVAREWINLRSGPGVTHPVQWKLDSGYPLRVIGSKKGWLKVVDFEGDRGWILARLASAIPHMVVRSDLVNIRAKPALGADVVAQAKRGTVFRTLDRRGDWVQVRHRDGIVGWVAKRLLWGW